MIPYDKLHIYEISGAIDLVDETLPPDYLGTWWEGGHAFLFFSREREDMVQCILSRRPTLILVGRYTMDYRDWQGGDDICSFRVGQLAFVPPWEEAPASTREPAILLDPSVVFGTGFHPTTRGCLEALLQVYQRCRPRRVLDLGTGTGILALAAARLGAKRIIAVDCNPLAVKTAKKNVNMNGEEGRIDVLQGRAENVIHQPADLVCCNLHLPVLNQLIDTDAFFRKPWCIVSGFFQKDGEIIREKLRDRGVNTEVMPVPSSWQTLLGSHV